MSVFYLRGETISSIFDAWQKDRFILLISKEIIDEIDVVIDRFVKKKIINLLSAIALARRLRKNTKRVKVTSVVDISKDKKDNRYLACGKDGKADYLVTGDKRHLISLKKFGITAIITPKEFVRVLEKSN